MARDPHGNKIGQNDPCWCGSGIKYKRCHYNREFQINRSFGYYENQMRKIEQNTSFCSCGFDSNRCVSKIVKAHSVSKSSSLSEIEDKGHVLTFDLAPSNEENDISDSGLVSLRKIGTNMASTVRAFCEYHDNVLFRELDRLDFSSKELFFWQLFYRTLCFERYRKLVATKIVPQMRELDKGKSISEQPIWQDHITNQQIAHTMGYDDLDKLRNELEAIFEGTKYVGEVTYLYYLIPQKLPLAAAGVFQPDLNISGEALQRVNMFYRIEGKYVAPPLDDICMSILPFKGGTVLSLCALRKHERSLRFMQTFRLAAKSIVDNFVGLAVLKMENIYFGPKYIASLPRQSVCALKRLHSFGTGEDVQFNEMAEAMRLRLFPPAHNIECTHNLDI